MESIRNSIKVDGLTDPGDLSCEEGLLLFQFAETETLTIPESQPEMTGIYQIRLTVEKEASHTIKTPLGTALVLDGLKRFQLFCTCEDEPDKARLISLEVPFNSLLEPPAPVSIENIAVHVLDAYFSLLGPRRLYSHLVFMICLRMPDIVPIEDNTVEYHSVEPSGDILFHNEIKGHASFFGNQLMESEALAGENEEELIRENQDDQLVDMDSEYL